MPSQLLPPFRGHGVHERHLAFQFAYFCSSLARLLLLFIFIIVFPKYLCYLRLLYDKKYCKFRHFYKIMFRKMSELFSLFFTEKNFQTYLSNSLLKTFQHSIKLLFQGSQTLNITKQTVIYNGKSAMHGLYFLLHPRGTVGSRCRKMIAGERCRKDVGVEEWQEPPMVHAVVLPLV